MVNKITTPPTQNEVIDKINELVDDKQDNITSSNKLSASLVSGLATVATSGSYNDLTNKPIIPAAQVNSDWNAASGVAQILNKPTIPTVNNPTITFTQGGTTKGTITLNQSTNQTINFDAGGGGGSYTAGDGIIIENGEISVDGEEVNLLTLATVAISGSYNDLSNKPTIPTVNNATLTIQKNGTNVATFTANASSNVTANISVPNTVSSVSSSSTNADAVGAKLFYDTVGDVETVINTIRGV